MNPFERWTARQAASHPFITNAPFTGDFVPPADPKVNERKLAYLVATQHKPAPRSGLSARMHGGGLHDASTHGGGRGADGSGHMFLPLSRRQSEPVQRPAPVPDVPSSGGASAAGATTSAGADGEAKEFDVNQRRPLQRGMTVIERSDGRLVETPVVDNNRRTSADVHGNSNSSSNGNVWNSGGTMLRTLPDFDNAFLRHDDVPLRSDHTPPQVPYLALMIAYLALI